jgi:translation initiation factor IF-2
MAATEGVDIRHYSIIYNLIDDVAKALKGMLEPTFAKVVDGHAEVRAMFPAGKNVRAAGVYVTDGKIARNLQVRITRGGEVLTDTTITSLRRFKDNVREVTSDYECGVGIKDFTDFREGDILEFYHEEKQA